MKSCFENWEHFHGLNIRYFIIQEEVRSQVGETLRFRFATGSGKGVALRRGKLKGLFLHRQPLFDPVPNIVCARCERGLTPVLVMWEVRLCGGFTGQKSCSGPSLQSGPEFDTV